MTTDRDPLALTAPLLLAAAAALVPWTAYLAATLPAGYDTSSWSGTWVGYDVLLLLVLGAAGLLARARHHLFAPAALVGATLLCADAWFDVMTASAADRPASLATAVLVELPLAVVLGRAGLAGTARPAPAGDR